MSTPIDTDVLVVGGGVAGATTARLLAEFGHHVILLDRARFPRDKPCGEGVMPTGVRLLDRLGVLRSSPPISGTSSAAWSSSYMAATAFTATSRTFGRVLTGA